MNNANPRENVYILSIELSKFTTKLDSILLEAFNGEYRTMEFNSYKYINKPSLESVIKSEVEKVQQKTQNLFCLYL